MKKIKEIAIAIIIPNVIGFLGSLIGNPSAFDNIIKPSFTPPKIVFPIVWVILYTLMGISSYLIYKSNSNEKDESLFIYLISLVLNSLWSFFFFKLKAFLFAFIWLILILISVILFVIKFYKINKLSGLLQIPYIIWLIFAGILNLSIYFLN